MKGGGGGGGGANSMAWCLSLNFLLTYPQDNLYWCLQKACFQAEAIRDVRLY